MQPKLSFSKIALTALSTGIILTFLLEWQFSPLNKAIAWYHLKTNNYTTTLQATKYISTLLENEPLTTAKLANYPYLEISETITEIVETAKPYTVNTALDPLFLADNTYLFPFGQDGVFDLEHHSLFVEGKEATTFTVVGKTLSETINQTVYSGKKPAEELKKEVLAQWKVLVTALEKKEAKQAEELVSFAETEKFAKTVKLSE